MRKAAVATTVALAVTGLGSSVMTASAQTTNQGSSSQTTEHKTTQQTSTEHTSNVSDADRKFLDDAYSINEGEIQLGHLAEQKGTNQTVKSYGRHMVTDHTRALSDLKRVASKVHVTLPTQVDPATKAQHDELSKKSGADFDTSYLTAMVSGHEAAVREFDQEASNGQNSAIKGYAQSTLPILRDHLNMARDAVQKQTPGVAEPQQPSQQQPSQEQPSQQQPSQGQGQQPSQQQPSQQQPSQQHP